MIGIAWSIVHFGYHTLFEIIGGTCAALFLIKLYAIAQPKAGEHMPWIIIALATVTVTYIYISYKHLAFHYLQLPSHTWMAYFVLIGLIAGEMLFKMRGVMQMREKVTATLIFTLTAWLIQNLFQQPVIAHLPDYLMQMQWFLYGITLPAACNSASYLAFLFAKPINT